MYETLLSVDELANLINDHTPVIIVDCRFLLANVNWGLEEYMRSHIPNAIYAHMNEDLSGPIISGETGRHPLPDPAVFVEWVQKAGISNQSQVIVYDQGNGGMAARLWWLMRWLGHDAVAVLDGGWVAWQHANMPVDDSIPQPERSAFIPSMRPELIVNADEVGEWACDMQHVVVDSREARRYAGIEEPIDPVAGHIPGAINKPFGENNNPDGTWKTKEELRQRFSALVENNKGEDVAFYCGSGVTASQNVLAFKHAGFGDAKLYPGSWSEWILSDEHEIERSEM